MSPIYDDNPFYLRDYNQCINCWRCVQVCAEDAQFTYALSFDGRGFRTQIGTFMGLGMIDTTSAFCTRWQVIEFSLFGSFVTGQMYADSDVDVLVTFTPGARPTLFDLVKMQLELESIFGRKVDLIERKGLEHSPNPIRRQEILNSLETISAQT